jgi:hypothetical protein
MPQPNSPRSKPPTKYSRTHKSARGTTHMRVLFSEAITAAMRTIPSITILNSRRVRIFHI